MGVVQRKAANLDEIRGELIAAVLTRKSVMPHEMVGFKINEDVSGVRIHAECNMPGAIYDDGVSFGVGLGYREYPANSKKKIRARIGVDFLDFGKYPNLGFECPVCEFTEYAKKRHEEELSSSQSQGERMLRETLEEIYDKRFPNLRPNWLINPATGSRLELDCFSREMMLAFEYQGLQHYEPITFFGGQETFKKVVERDKTKRELCKSYGVTLIEIDSRVFPHTTKKKTLEKHIVATLKRVKQELLATTETKCQ